MTTATTTEATATKFDKKNLHVFIVPNPLIRLSECWDDGIAIRQDAEWFGVQNTNPDDLFVECWVVDPQGGDHSNLTDHRWTTGDGRDHLVPTYIPVSLLRNKREGETVEFSNELGQWRIELRQLPYRYGRHGSFEEVLGYLINTANKQ